MDFHAAAAPHLEQLEDRVKQLLAEADLEAADIGAVVLRGGDPVIPDLEAGLTRSGLPGAVVLREPHAIVRGALRLTQPLSAAAGGTAETMRLPRTRLTLASLARIAVLAACSVALFLQTVTSAYVSKIGGTIVWVLFQVENLGLAAALAALTAWAAAQLAPTTWVLAKQADDEVTTGTLLRRGFLGAAALGLAIAGLWGLGASIGVGKTDETYLTVALAATAPIALSAAVIALVAPRIPAPSLLAWLHRASPPVLPIALATVGVYAQWTVYTTRHLPYLNFAFGLLEIGGAALLGVATALTATRQPLLRIIAAVILGVGYVLVADVSTTGYLTIAYTVLLAWWAITTAVATMMTGSTGISAWLTRMITPPK
ncbi:hypothetical protein [Actinoplanes utahensis]|uniref:hypothetical protein n=1 Tax=Actinoplanes utahensis TaxID=1869 RepID=UPI00126A7767|nr:hypothetical protein [Actinoplanes utahensis]